jgi:hypothetical protein
MLSSQLSLASAQLSRNTAAEIQESPTPWRDATLEGWRRRNAVLDAIFYDVGKVTRSEAACLSPWLAKEGAILIVPPTGAEPLTLCPTIGDFEKKGGRDLRALAVAGVGSSALGSAAFARNVADAFGQPVAAVVSGYGLSDLVTEALGGFFLFGALNSIRHFYEQLDQLARRAQQAALEASAESTTFELPRMSLDTQTVYRLLSDRRFHFKLLTGHYKGNLVLSEALYELDEGHAPATLSKDTWLVTISAVIAMPPRYRNIVDVIGCIDWFGAMNSRLGLGIEQARPWAWHHTNTELPFHLPVTKVFGDLIASRGITL